MRLISGFYEEEIEWPSGSTERVIVIGAIEYPSFLDRLTEYVNEAERLHQLARKNSLGSSGQNVDTGFKAGLSGRTTVKASPEHEADLFHDKVLEALHGALKNYGIQATNNRHADMCPDLYTNDSNGHLQCLFEIKTRHNTTSLYTGIGQLAVYGADQTIQPKRILVCPGLHHHPNFAAALKQHGIEFLKYQIDDKENVGFPDICALMKRLTCK